MDPEHPSYLQTFVEKAEASAAQVIRVPDLEQALDQVVQSCAAKQACTPLATGCEQDLSEAAADLCSLKDWSKIMAAPGLAPRDLEALTSRCKKESIKLIQTGLRSHLGGIDVGLTWAEYGIAETGTAVLNSSLEDVRLAGMISEIHAVLLPATGIVPDTAALNQALAADFGKPPNYTSFITGPSRTADIERVLTLGVHGPLDVHIYIIEDNA
ncbi:LutC/YkgG family protein [Desulfovermiculus halophilus]|uniref:LutC/YkgG family protein n=1 Tax=Desulfovermiculus halophilus TaxID=339722 RepID=UPI00054DD8E4|nr:lactate utilization protein [Desulfovermiculus halophilus]